MKRKMHAPHSGSKYYSREIAEKVLSRKLKGTEQVHHVDENPFNNEHINLVVCPDQAYHNLLHVRQRAYDACGNASFRKCHICKTYDDTALMYFSKYQSGSGQYWHRACKNQYECEKYNKKINNAG